jgi:hypothetical protein
VNEPSIAAEFFFGILDTFIVNASLTATSAFGKTRSDARRMNNVTKRDTMLE